MKSFLQNNNIEMYSKHNEGKIKKCVYVDKLEVIVNKYNYMYHKIIKMKPADVNPSM